MRVLSILFLMLLLLSAAPGRAQERPLVVFIEEPRTLNMSSVTDNGADGLTRLAALFEGFGARTSWVRLSEPVPEEARVIVLVRPRSALTPSHLARIWQSVGAGNGLLIALEPSGYMGGNTETSGSGLDKLLTYDVGVSLLNGILIEPWFSNDSLRSLHSTFSFGYPDSVPNPITDPLRQYELPVALWGARPVRVEPFGADSVAWALADAMPEFAETATNIFPSRNNDGTPFELNLDKDQQGWVHVAAFGENTSSGARTAVLGDAEIVENGYGLALIPGGNAPRHPANAILTQRLVAWLLRVPEDQYPELPPGLTWIALDGKIDDWATSAPNAPVTPDDPADSAILSLNIQQVRAFRNTSYLYLSIEMAAQANDGAQVNLQFDTTGSGQADTTLAMLPAQIVAQSGDQSVEIVADAGMAIGDGIELRVPLRLTGDTPRVVSLCVNSARDLAFPQSPDCMDSAVQISRVTESDPVPLRYSEAPVLVMRGDGYRANVRQSPSATARVLVSVPAGTVFAAIGRTADGNWLQVQNAAYKGWIAKQVLYAEDGDFEMLPVTG